MKHARATITVVVGLSVAIGLFQGGCGAVSEAVEPPGDITNEASVVTALEGTGYDIKLRRVPRVEGYEMVAGRATNKSGGVVDFSATVKTAGPIDDDPESRRGGSPQFPIVRYSEADASLVGNLAMVTQPQSQFVRGRLNGVGKTYVASHGESQMVARIQAALYNLFAPGVRGGP